MIVRKTLGIKAVYEFAGHHLIWLTCWMTFVTVLYDVTHWKWMTIPWLPLSIIGTAVAFYVGFKNNQSYDRLWEARKIWGAIINNSRMLATMVKHFANSPQVNVQTAETKRRIIHRHIAYIYTLRQQLLEPTEWEHVSLNWRFGSYNRRRKAFLDQKYHKELLEITNHDYLSQEEQQALVSMRNKATQIIDLQSRDIASLHHDNSIDIMQYVELQRVLNSFYDEQGKAERIKKFPFPRQYGSFSLIFISFFIFLLPFGCVGEFSKLGDHAVWLSIPFGAIIGWVYIIMELIGDYSENPFEGLSNDIPMLSICRTIEIDLLQMMGEQRVPMPIQPKHGVLM